MRFRSLVLALGFAIAAPVFALSPGQAAPDFNLPATDGKPVKLSDFKGKWVVLEWVNPGCPYVVKHYESRNMQGLQKEFGARDVVWLAVNSTHKGHYDYLKPAAMADWMKAKGGTPKATLMDEDGRAGRAYDARTTPHMYVVDPQGRLAYIGAIDDKRSANPDDVKGARNHVKAALTEALAGKSVSLAASVPYGCSVKYN